jgi:GNAT superfamily N-acetyltransferase
MLALVQSGEEPGLLGYLNGEAVGWCAVAPRDQYSALARSRVLKPVDDKPVWSVSCLLVRKSERRQGVSVRLLQETISFVRDRGGTIVEGYPVEPKSGDVPGVFAWTGLVSAFLQAGFHECHRHSPSRPIMRFEIA